MFKSQENKITAWMIRLTAIFLTVILVSGCAGSRCTITANEVKYPVSLSRSVYDSSGKIVTPKGSQILDHFTITWKNWHVFWSIIPLTKVERDISSELNEKVQAKNGNAIVNLTVTSQSDWYGIISSWALVIPDYIDVEVQGDVVRIDE